MYRAVGLDLQKNETKKSPPLIDQFALLRGFTQIICLFSTLVHFLFFFYVFFRSVQPFTPPPC